MKRLISCNLLLAFTIILSTSLAFAIEKEESVNIRSLLACQIGSVANYVDINNATEGQLKDLPGIDEAYYMKIIAGRPYTNMNQLLLNNTLPHAIFDKIRDYIVITPPE
jgi:radical SAM superfamily enzyme with C-terminal helix-hairpin-helix motif